MQIACGEQIPAVRVILMLVEPWVKAGVKPHAHWKHFPRPCLHVICIPFILLYFYGLINLLFLTVHSPCRILVPRLGIKPGPWQWVWGVLTPGQAGNSLFITSITTGLAKPKWTDGRVQGRVGEGFACLLLLSFPWRVQTLRGKKDCQLACPLPL